MELLTILIGTVALVAALIGLPLLLILYATGQYPNWRKRSKDYDRQRK